MRPTATPTRPRTAPLSRPSFVPPAADLAPIEAAIATKADAAATATALANKANASTVGGLSTALNSKASQSAVDALAGTVAGKADASAVPKAATLVPMGEAVAGAVGGETEYARGDHRHPRLTSTTGNTTGSPASHVIGSGGTVQILFTRTFSAPPGTVFTEVPPPTGSMPAQGANFRVESWVRETMTPTPAGAYIGCVVRAWRGQSLPNLGVVSGILTAVITGVNAIVSALSGYNPFGAPAAGTAFTCIAVARSDA
ncbi:hypothetical protein FHS96_004998 [Sphingomonas zeicaulis]|uniref:hypothetical protein n=1 Tax=Sphingomonas zeicaulis TaxID=1632740 RepID=UPI003D202E08